MLNKIFPTLISFCVLCVFIGSGCSGSYKATRGTEYLYTYTLTQPIQNKELLYQDNFIIVQFKIDESAVNFQLQNVSDAPMTIAWDRVSIGVNNQIFPIRNSSTLYTVGSVIPLPFVIPSLGFVKDMVIPRDNISFENNLWSEKEIFPIDDKGSINRKKMILKFVGNEILLNFPVKIADVTKEYSFTFKVSKIEALPANVVLPVKERPTAPKQPIREAQMGSQLIPLGITLGILGIAIYLFSQKKEPAASF